MCICIGNQRYCVLFQDLSLNWLWGYLKLKTNDPLFMFGQCSTLNCLVKKYTPQFPVMNPKCDLNVV